MMSKKVIGIATLIIVAVTAASPIFIYGLTVYAVEIDTGIQVYGSMSPGSTLNFAVGINQYTIGEPSVEVNERALNAYEYLATRIGGIVQTSDEGASGTTVVDINIVFDLTTPGGQSLSFSFDPQELRGTGLKHIIVLLGPDELNRETGEFYLSITISIKVALSEFDLPVVDQTLTPVNLSFIVPQSG